MKVIIVGAGITGLSLAISLAQNGHQAIVLESAHQLAEIGAGIQMTPQAIKYLFAMGLEKDIRARCIIPRGIDVRDWKDGEVVGSIDVAGMEKRYGAPYILIHRPILHEILHAHGVEAGAEIRVNSRVVEYDFDDGKVKLWNGQVEQADLVVGADGIDSFARSQLLDKDESKSRPTGFAAIRMMASMADIQADPELSHLVNLQTCSSNWWLAPERSIMTYLIKDASTLNLVLSHQNAVDTTNFTVEQYRALIEDLFGNFEPRARKLLAVASDKIANWPVYAVPPLQRWKSSSSRFVLVGDAAHGMAFFLSMGVSLAVEDAVALTAALSFVDGSSVQRPDVSELALALNTYVDVRKRRAETVAAQSLRAGQAAHLPDGAAREEMLDALGRPTNGECPLTVRNEASPDYIKKDQRPVFGIGDQTIRDWCYGYDAVDEISRVLQEQHSTNNGSDVGRTHNPKGTNT